MKIFQISNTLLTVFLLFTVSCGEITEAENREESADTTGSVNTHSPEAKLDLDLLESMQDELDRLEKRLGEIDFEEAEKQQPEVAAYHKYYSTEYADSSKEARNFWIYDLSALERCNKAFKRSIGSKEDLKKKIKKTREQLHNLKYTYKDEKITKGEFEDFLLTERHYVGDIARRVQYFDKEIELCISVLDTLAPKLEGVMKESRQK